MERQLFKLSCILRWLKSVEDVINIYHRFMKTQHQKIHEIMVLS